MHRKSPVSFGLYAPVDSPISQECLCDDRGPEHAPEPGYQYRCTGNDTLTQATTECPMREGSDCNCVTERHPGIPSSSETLSRKLGLGASLHTADETCKRRLELAT